MSLSPSVGKFLGHRRGRSSAVDICVDDDEPQEKSSNQPLLTEDEKGRFEFGRRKKPRGDVVVAGLWVLSVALTAVVTFLITRTVYADRDGLGSFRDGFGTELRAARSAIGHLHEQQFTGSLDFRDHHGFVPENSPSLKYMGDGPQIDAAWDALTKDRYFLLTDAEATEAYGRSPQKYWNEHHGGYVAGLDAIHTLHCLDHLRRSLYPKTYPQDPVDGPTHKAHCVDHLRQLVMCNADLTPVPTQFFPGLERSYINSSRVHTCREFGAVREWASERFNGSLAVKPRNRDGSPRKEFYAPWGPT